jgi:hypothetical protein
VTGPEHYDEAERILLGESCEFGCPHSGCAHEMRMIARAQAHATLALAAATALRTSDGTDPGPDYRAWTAAAATPRQKDEDQ